MERPTAPYACGSCGTEVHTTELDLTGLRCPNCDELVRPLYDQPGHDRVRLTADAKPAIRPS